MSELDGICRFAGSTGQGATVSLADARVSLSIGLPRAGVFSHNPKYREWGGGVSTRVSRHQSKTKTE